jgi:hypothetical protein
VMNFFRDRVFLTICPGLASNRDPSDLCLLVWATSIQLRDVYETSRASLQAKPCTKSIGNTNRRSLVKKC